MKEIDDAEFIKKQQGGLSYKVDQLLTERYWLVRILFLRCLAFMYLVAFLVAFFQNEALIGEKGLTPAVNFLGRWTKATDIETLRERVFTMPTFFWFIEPTTDALNQFALAGCGISFSILVLGSANIPLLFALWSLYFSIVSVGQTWYSFGWESQLLESGFLAMFMVPVFSLSRFPAYTPTPWVAIWGYRWLLFRIMIGAGMIKIRGDQCWRDLTCMNYHYQTQPVPNPFSIYFHNNPETIHRLETLGNHIIELGLPLLLLVPIRPLRFFGAAVQLLFQGVLIMSGNLAFLNWLTALPAIMCFDDAAVSHLLLKFPSLVPFCFCTTPAQQGAVVMQAIQAEERYRRSGDTTDAADSSSSSSSSSSNNSSSGSSDSRRASTGRWLSWRTVSVFVRRLTTLCVAGMIAYMSYPVLTNILSSSQAMNTSFEPFRIVNSYGAFGSITKVRHEVIIQGTTSAVPDETATWLDYDFRCKPGNINRRPCWISPYHLRIDWLMWFAAFQSYQQCPWLVNVADKLLSGDPIAQKLLSPDGDPFNSNSADATTSKRIVPTWIRAELFEYEYASLDPEQSRKDAEEGGWEVGRWWKRKHVSSYMPAVEANNFSIDKFLRAHRMRV